MYKKTSYEGNIDIEQFVQIKTSCYTPFQKNVNILLCILKI